MTIDMTRQGEADVVACGGDSPIGFTGSWRKSVSTAYSRDMVWRTFHLVRTFEGRFQVVQDVPNRSVKSEVSHLPQRSHSPRRPLIPQNAPRYAGIDPNRAAPPTVRAFCRERSAWFGVLMVVSNDMLTSPIDWSSRNFRTPHCGGTTSGGPYCHRMLPDTPGFCPKFHI